MKRKINKKMLFNIYTSPAIILTIIFVLATFNEITWTHILVNIGLWVTGILLYKKKNLSSLISIILLIFYFFDNINKLDPWIDPYYFSGILILFYIVCELVIFYKKDNIKMIYKKTCTIIITLILATSISFSVVDYNLVRNEEMPIFMISLTDKSSSEEPWYKWEYIGLGYKMTVYNEIKPTGSTLENFKVDFGNWFYLFMIESVSDRSSNESNIEFINDLIKMEITSLSDTEITLSLENTTEDNYTYGEDYHLEIKENNKWYILNPIEDMIFISIGYSLTSGNTDTHTTNFSYHYKTLEKGTYRIVKSLHNDNDIPITEADNKFISAEFEIK